MRRCLAIAITLAWATNVFAQIKAITYATGLNSPIAMVQDPTNSHVQFVVQQRGRIKVVVDGVTQGTDFLNLIGIVNSTGSERGLLGLTFHPNYAVNGYFYVNYTSIVDGSTNIVRYTRSANPLVADAATAFPLLTIAQPYQNHNGGTIKFGEDGYLYIGMGDGGNSYDPGNRAQDLNNLLGKFLRIDVNGDDFPADSTRNYRIPPTNPFAGATTGADEIWSCGVRNPWKWSFDRTDWLGDGALMIADVGQDTWEELDFEPAGTGGRNYGWRQWEGFASTGLSGANSITPTSPIYVYDHTVGISITGGQVYRGTALGSMFGRYFFADYGAGRIWSAALLRDANGNATGLTDVREHTAELGLSGALIPTIDVDASGELYFTNLANSRLMKILPNGTYQLVDLTPKIHSTFSGSIRHVLGLDGHKLAMYPQEELDLLDQNQAQLVLGYTTDLVSPATFNVRVTASANATGGKLQIWLKNWTTGKFVLQGALNLGINNATLTKSAVAAPSYVRGDGRVELMIRTYNNVDVPIDPYTAFLDQVEIYP
ncbi:MAG: PQQ-dependent sugar dehydrogenase [Fimbriimonadales bacterium]